MKKKILIVGASGVVGQQVLALALNDINISHIIALTRSPLPTHPRLQNVIVDFDNLPVDEEWWNVDAVICSLGTTIAKAGSAATFTKIDYGYALQVARVAKAHGVATYALTSAMGADPHSRIFYLRTKGELEQALSELGFSSLTLVRPSLIDSQRSEFRRSERLLLILFRLFRPLIPKRYRAIKDKKIANCLLNAALTAKPGKHIVESDMIN